MKNSKVLIAAVVTFLLIGVTANAEYFREYFNTVLVRNALTVVGTTALQGTTTITGAATLTAPTFTGTVTATSHFISDLLANRARFTVGSTAGTGAGRLYAGDSIYVATTLFVDASRNVSAGTVSGTSGTFTSLITSGANFATRDSFTTTSATKVVTIAGADVGDVFIVSPRTYTYSATADTGQQYRAKWDSTGYVTVTRTAYLASSSVKSGAHFDVIRIDK